MSEIKLKPCPFCGGEAIIYENDEDDEYMIGCKNCCAAEPMTEWASKENAIAQWNTRKPVERVLGRLEEEKEKYDTLSENALSEFCLEMFHLYSDTAHGLEIAIKIIKEETL